MAGWMNEVRDIGYNETLQGVRRLNLHTARRRLVVLAALTATIVAVWAVWHFAASHSSERGKGVEPTVSRYPAVTDIRNVVLISIDTCRADRLSCYGYGRKSTPNIDAVARDGVLFQQALVSVPMTLPSHSSMMTGAYPPTHGVRANDGYHLLPLSSDGQAGNVTLAKILHNAGFQTAAFVGGFPLDARFGLDQGFETYDGRFDKEGGKRDRRTAEEVTARGLAWLDGHDKAPFFLFLHYYDAHHPYHPPAPFDKTFADDPYAGGIAYVDSSIGRVIDRLRARGLYDNTLLIIVGDHGEALGEHGEQTHSFYVYQSTLHVPLIIRAPGVGPSRQIAQTVNLVDLMPTTLSLLGLPQPKRVEGVDLRDYLAGNPWQGEAPASYFESLEPAVFNCCPLQGLVDGRWKYIRAPRPELYDLAADPKELTNLAAQETETVRRLRDKLESQLAAMKAAAAPGNSSLVDPAASKRLESLGYVGGRVLRPEFDPRSEDPKDFAAIHAMLDKANEFNRAGQLDDAKKECLAIIAQRPNLVQAHILLGELASKQQHPDEAVQSLSSALAILTESRKKTGLLPAAVENNEIAAIYSHRGIALMMLGKMAQAEADFKAALAIDPESDDLQYNLGNLYLVTGRTEEAVACYRKTLAINPQYMEAHHYWGRLLAASGRVNDAIAHYEKALEIQPLEAEVLVDLANALLARGRPDDAILRYGKALEIKPNDVRVRVSLADTQVGRGRGDEAIAQYRTALKAAPDDVDANNNLGLALAGKGQTDEAIAQYRKALKINSNYAPAHNNLGLALASLGKVDEAIAQYEAAIRINPNYAEAHNNLGVALAAGRGQMEAAIAHFQRALEIRPNYVGARQNLEHARAKQ